MSQRANTRERILHTALTVANRDGLDAVTIRAMAAQLGLSPGNVSYHFPRRTDLILALSGSLSQRNEPLGQLAPDNLEQMLERYRSTLRHHYQHRGLVIALPNLMETSAEWRTQFRRIERKRFAQQRAQLVHLRSLGHLDAKDIEIDRLVTHISLVARFWLAESRTTHRRRSIETVIGHYLGLIADLLQPHATNISRQTLNTYIAGILPLTTSHDEATARVGTNAASIESHPAT